MFKRNDFILFKTTKNILLNGEGKKWSLTVDCCLQSKNKQGHSW